MKCRLGLIADDSARDRELVRRVLELAGITALETNHGPDTLFAARTELPDVILLDRFFEGGWRGTSILHQLKSDPLTDKIPVIMISGFPCDEDELGALVEAGVHSYWTKPLHNLERHVMQLRTLPNWLRPAPPKPLPDLVRRHPELAFQILRLAINEPAFISYAFKDKLIVEEFVSWIENIGIECLIAARDLQPSSNISQTLAEQIGHCGSAFVFITEASVRSEWVRAEVAALLRRHKTIVPIRLAPNLSPGDIHIALTDVACIDLFVP